MNVKVTEQDIETLGFEIQSCEDVGLESLFFKFTEDHHTFLFDTARARDLLITLQALMTYETVHLSVDISNFVKGVS